MKSLSASARLPARVAEYGASHRHPVNRALHFVGIPLLGTAALGLLSKLSVSVGAGSALLEPNAAWPAMLVAAAWYFGLDGVLGLLSILVLVGCYAAGCALSREVLLGLFTAGALTHLVGHYFFEGKAPAFISNPLAVLEAPAWLVAQVLGPARWNRF